MWIAKFKIYDKENKFRELIEGTKVDVCYYPLNFYIKNKRYFFVSIGIVKGENKNRFFYRLRKLKKEKTERRVEFLEIHENFFVLITSHNISEEEKRYVNLFYNPKIIHPMPVIFREDGWEYWEAACVEREDLEKIIDLGVRLYDFELLSFSKKKIKNFGFMTLLPDLTEKQQQAISFALDSGYYNYPRKTSLDKLSKKTKRSFSTFQAHVRKAENKIISFVMGFSR